MGGALTFIEMMGGRSIWTFAMHISTCKGCWKFFIRKAASSIKVVYLNNFSRVFFYTAFEFLELVPELLLSRLSAFCIKYYERRSPTNFSGNFDSWILRILWCPISLCLRLHCCTLWHIFGKFQLEHVVEGKVMAKTYSAVLYVCYS